MKQINNIHNDAEISEGNNSCEIKFKFNQTFKSRNNHVLNVQKINDPPPGPLPSFERMDFTRSNGNVAMRVFPDRGPGRFLRKILTIARRFFMIFSGKIREVGNRSVVLYIYPLMTPGVLTGSYHKNF